MSIHTSRQDATDVILDVECPAEGCAFAGRVDAAYDPELSRTEATWTCPECGTDNTEERE